MAGDSVANLQQRIQASLLQTRRCVARLQMVHALLVATTILTGALSTLLAGISAAIGAAVIGEGEAGWRLVCAVVAVITFAGTVAAGIIQQFRVPQALAEARACAGRLSALDVALGVGNVSAAEIAGKYADIVAEFQAVLQ